jgi:hypothetical protein
MPIHLGDIDFQLGNVENSEGEQAANGKSERQAYVKTARTENEEETLESPYAIAIEKHRQRDNNEVIFESDVETAGNKRVEAVISQEVMESPDNFLKDKFFDMKSFERASQQIFQSAAPETSSKSPLIEKKHSLTNSDSFKDFYSAIENQQEGEVKHPLSASNKPKLKLRLKPKFANILAGFKQNDMGMIPEVDEKLKQENLDVSQQTIKMNIKKIKLSKHIDQSVSHERVKHFSFE